MRPLRRRELIGLLALLAAVVGWFMFWPNPSLALPTEVERLTIYSIDGNCDVSRDDPPAGGETFHKYPVLGSVDVTDPATRTAVLEAIDRGVRSAGSQRARCFMPRHGVRVVGGKRTVDLVICFECLYLYVKEDRETHGRITNRTAQRTLNDVLRGAGVPLAPGMTPDE